MGILMWAVPVWSKLEMPCSNWIIKRFIWVRGDREVTFESKDAGNPAKFYFNSVTAHRNYPEKK